MTQSAYTLDQKTMQWKRDREQKGERWLRCFTWRYRAPLRGMTSILCTRWMQHPACPAGHDGSCRGSTGAFAGRVVSGPWEMERRWHGVQFYFHWLEAEQVKWSSVILLAVEHNSLLFKRRTVRCSSSFYPDVYWHICNHSNYGWKNRYLVIFKLPSE